MGGDIFTITIKIKTQKRSDRRWGEDGRVGYMKDKDRGMGTSNGL
jgi:hypothetical protein